MLTKTSFRIRPVQQFRSGRYLQNSSPLVLFYYGVIDVYDESKNYTEGSKNDQFRQNYSTIGQSNNGDYSMSEQNSVEVIELVCDECKRRQHLDTEEQIPDDFECSICDSESYTVNMISLFSPKSHIDSELSHLQSMIELLGEESISAETRDELSEMATGMVDDLTDVIDGLSEQAIDNNEDDTENEPVDLSGMIEELSEDSGEV